MTRYVDSKTIGLNRSYSSLILILILEWNKTTHIQPNEIKYHQQFGIRNERKDDTKANDGDLAQFTLIRNRGLCCKQ